MSWLHNWIDLHHPALYLLLQHQTSIQILSHRVFGLAASFVAELASIWGPLPMLVLAVPSTIGGVLSLR